MDTIYVALTDTFNDGREFQVSIERDEDWFVVLDYKDAEGDFLPIEDDSFTLSASESAALGRALSEAGAAAKAANESRI